MAQKALDKVLLLFIPEGDYDYNPEKNKVEFEYQSDAQKAKQMYDIAKAVEDASYFDNGIGRSITSFSGSVGQYTTEKYFVHTLPAIIFLYPNSGVEQTVLTALNGQDITDDNIFSTVLSLTGVEREDSNNSYFDVDRGEAYQFGTQPKNSVYGDRNLTKKTPIVDLGIDLVGFTLFNESPQWIENVKKAIENFFDDLKKGGTKALIIVALLAGGFFYGRYKISEELKYRRYRKNKLRYSQDKAELKQRYERRYNKTLNIE